MIVTAERLLKLRTRVWRLVLASFVGSLFSLLIFLDVQGFLFSVTLKVVSTLAVSVIAFRFDSLKELLKNAVLTLLSSFLFSGAMTAIYQLFHPPNMLIINDIVYFEFDPLIMLAVTAAIYLAVAAAERVFRERLRSTVIRAEFTAEGKEYTLIGKIDTGCALTEPFSGAPVMIADERVFSIPDDAEKRIVPYSDLSGSSVMFAVRADSITIDGKRIDKEVYAACGSIKNSSYQLLINPDILR